MAKFPNEMHLVKGLDPIADAFSGTVYSDVVEVQGDGIQFIIYKGVGTTGTSTITINACDDVTPTTESAVAFWYRKATTGDTWGDWTAATTSGFATTAGSSQLYQIVVPADQIVASAEYGYARLKAVEVVNDPVLGGILCGVYGLRNAEQPSTLIT